MLHKRHKLEVYATQETQTGSLCYTRHNWKFMLHKRHKLEVYATQEGIQVETCVYFKIVQTLVGIRYNLHFKFCSLYLRDKLSGASASGI